MQFTDKPVGDRGNILVKIADKSWSHWPVGHGEKHIEFFYVQAFLKPGCEFVQQWKSVIQNIPCRMMGSVNMCDTGTGEMFES